MSDVVVLDELASPCNEHNEREARLAAMDRQANRVIATRSDGGLVATLLPPPFDAVAVSTASAGMRRCLIAILMALALAFASAGCDLRVKPPRPPEKFHLEFDNYNNIRKQISREKYRHPCHDGRGIPYPPSGIPPSCPPGYRH